MVAVIAIAGAINGYQPLTAGIWQVSDDMMLEIIEMDVTSPDFRNGERMPVKYTADGYDMSPPLRWSGAPEGTAEFAVICDDPDAPGGTFTHWVIYKIPGNYDRLDEGIMQVAELDNGAMQGKNSFGRIGYGGPSPPKGKPHRYIFTVYALDAKLDLPAGITKDQLQRAMQGHVIGMGKLIGLYGR
ncbi:MAG: YbhB/YbcL family Raf kinase inhibitor-like protein [Bacillota bacterium]